MPFDDTDMNGGGGGGPCEVCGGRGFVHALIVTDDEHFVQAHACPHCAKGEAFEAKARDTAAEIRSRFGGGQPDGDNFRRIGSILRGMLRRGGDYEH